LINTWDQWQELKIWFLLDPSSLCDIINPLIETRLLPELKQARVVIIAKPGRRNRICVKAYCCISLLPTIAKLVEKVISVQIVEMGE
jgi:hypothetical protein